MLKVLRQCFPILFILSGFFSFSANEQVSKPIILRWDNQIRYDSTLNSEMFLLRIREGGVDQDKGLLPQYRFVTDLPSPEMVPQVTITNTFSDEFHHTNIVGIGWLTNDFQIQTNTFMQKGKWFAEILIIPARINTLTGFPELLSRFTLNINWVVNSSYKSVTEPANWPQNSVLATGNWLKFTVSNRGMVKITGADLKAAGVSISSINPAAIRVFGTGNPLLPEANSAQRAYDLTENYIYIYDNADGKFDASDYVLFYNPGCESWNYNSSRKKFIRTPNPYATSSTFFITWDGDDGKRISTKTLPTGTPNTTHTWFTDYFAHEQNLSNLVGTGRQWFGESFSLYDTKEFQLTFTNPVLSTKASLTSQVAGRSYSSSRFYVSVGDNSILTQPISAIVSSTLESNYAYDRYDTAAFTLTSATMALKYEYNYYSSSSEGWLDYYEINYRRQLAFTSPYMVFSNPNGTGTGKISKYVITNASSSMQVWDVTHPQQPELIPLQLSGQTASFNDNADTLRTYVAFNGSGFLSGSNWQRVANQNLHAVAEVDYIIISYPGFLEQANRLANFHRNQGLTVEVVTPEQIYNEFSSGSQDLSGIRDFLRMVYQRGGQGHELKWVLLFGDASYDYLKILEVDNNFVPTWESPASLNPGTSYATDDFYGLYDVTEGENCSGYIDVGIGRLLAQTADDAKAMVDKIIGYKEASTDNMRDWRNVICFVADDQDSDTHVVQSDNLAKMVDTTYRQFNIDKIYFDAYEQVSAPGGQRYPDVEDAINRRVESGALIMNYTGHGGELGWAHERVLQISDINSWRNLDNLPFFITATCEFSRYDDPLRESAGEKVFTNPLGGGIGLFTTSRLTYSSSNEQINRSFLSVLLARTTNGYLTLGEAAQKAKQVNGDNINGRKFVLLGDPAMKLAFPEYYAEATSIEYGLTGVHADTISALDEITIKGHVTDASGNTLTNFNGDLFPTVYDKTQQILTLGNDPDSPVYSFTLRKNALYKGQSEIANGEFEFSFIVPRDIEYRYGEGRLSLYARSDETDATGWSHDFTVGGYSKSTTEDDQPPQISLYMNDTTFINGGITDENPILLAFINDESGINVSGAGIGHDITAVLDGETSSPYILNDFYRSYANTYKKGSLKYPLYNLSSGRHTLKVTAWDVYNNPASATISFVVNESDNLVVENLNAYPNPFIDNVNFVFEHNCQDSDLNVEIEITDMVGRRIAALQQTISTGGFRTAPISWDGRCSNGQSLSAGFYIYRLKATAVSGGQTTEVTGRLIRSGRNN